MAITSFFGFVLAFLLSWGTLIWMGSAPMDLFQMKSIVFVVLGTFFALMVSYPLNFVFSSMALAYKAWSVGATDLKNLSVFFVESAVIARREGLLALESRVEAAPDPIVSKVMRIMIDGSSKEAINELLESEIKRRRSQAEGAARLVFRAAQITPAMGMLGAILGILPVFQASQSGGANSSRVMVSAFMSAFYGIAFAQWFLNPTAEKMQTQLEADLKSLEIIRVGVLGIQEGMSPVVLEEHLGALCG